MNQIEFPAQYADTLHKLDKLSRNHLLFFRLEVGKLLLDEFFDGDTAAYVSRDPKKPQKFTEFVASCAEHLADIGLSDTVARQCIVAHLVVKSLPPLTVEKLTFTQVLELTKVEDSDTRELLAHAAVKHHWATKELKGAVEAARAGKWIDGDLKTPGLQPPPPKPPEPPQYSAAHPPQAGRVVARIERLVADFDDVGAEFLLVADEKLSEMQRERVRAAVVGLEAKLAVVKGKVG